MRDTFIEVMAVMSEFTKETKSLVGDLTKEGVHMNWPVGMIIDAQSRNVENSVTVPMYAGSDYRSCSQKLHSGTSCNGQSNAGDKEIENKSN